MTNNYLPELNPDKSLCVSIKWLRLVNSKEKKILKKKTHFFTIDTRLYL